MTHSFYFAEEVKERKGKKMVKGKKFDVAENILKSKE